MKQLVIKFILGIALLLGFETLTAQTKLPAILSDNMCLQQAAEVKIWGWDTPGQMVTVNTSWAESVKTKTNKEGKWQVFVNTPKAGKTAQLNVIGSSSIDINNILFGEVWLCSGQSNMDRKLGFSYRQKPITNFWEESQKANYPSIRMFVVKRKPSKIALEDFQGEWMVCSPETVLNFSAVGYFYGKHLVDALKTPVGLIQSAWGGTPIEPWIPKEGFEKEKLEKADNLEKNYKRDDKNYRLALKNFKEGTIENRPKVPESVRYHNQAHKKLSVLYNSMISPLINYRIKGAIWYQGESNVGNWKEYKTFFPNMISSWRDKWNIGDFPFYFVQIAPYNYTNEFSVPQIVEAQKEALKLTNTGVAGTQDIGAFYDIHPPQKQEVGRRLSLIALNKTYGKSDIVYANPFLSSHKTEGEKLILQFETPNSQLFSVGESIGVIWPFYIAGADKIFYKAKVKQDGNTIILSSPNVANPIVARYNWANNANASIFNLQGLPALPFRTDTWDEVFYKE